VDWLPLASPCGWLSGANWQRHSTGRAAISLRTTASGGFGEFMGTGGARGQWRGSL
jgi:hypothetical protein